MPINMPERIEGSRIYLNKPEPTFALAREMFSVVEQSRDHILPWLDWASVDNTYRPEDCFVFLQGIHTRWKSGDCFEYLIHDKETHHLVGGFSVMLRDKRHFGVVELAYWLGKQYAEQGLMSEAVRAVEPILWALGIERIVIRNDVKNLASMSVARRCGYVWEGIARHDRYSECQKAWRDSNVFSKIKDEVKEG